MATAEERLRILRMVEQGELSATEAARLLEALDDRDAADTAERAASRPQRPTAKLPRRLRVRVTDLQSGQPKVDITMPWSLVSVGLGLGAHLMPPEAEVDLDEVVSHLESGTVGNVVDIVDDHRQERVEIFIE